MAEIETTEMVPVPQGAPVQLAAPLPEEVIEQATHEAKALARVIQDQKLYAVTGKDRDGKEKRHVQVEGWQTLGAMRGVFAVTEWSRRTPDFVPRIVTTEWKTRSNGKRYKDVTVVQLGQGGFEARVQLVNAAGVQVGAAEAECTWEEESWTTRPANALRSMAQTRAIGKAYRGVFAFVMALAGYEVTPAAEMPPAAPAVTDLHQLPEGWAPRTWGTTVAMELAGGDTAAAVERWQEACTSEGVGRTDELDKAQVEAVVEAMHTLDAAPDPAFDVVAEKAAPKKKAPAKKAAKPKAAGPDEEAPDADGSTAHLDGV